MSADKQTNPIYLLAFRVIDLGFALGVIVLFWWLLVLVWLAVKLTSNGPGIFAQERVGKGARNFTCLKFRTMKTGTVQAATHEVSRVSLTRIGSFLRRTKLDELPQVINILKGEMSLIGPRPCLPTQTVLIEARRKAGVYEIRPGITGLAQINNIDMSDPELLTRWDQRYMRERSLSLDLQILAATFLKRQNNDPVRKE